MTYLGDRPRLIQLQQARMNAGTARSELRNAPWWHKPALWWPLVVHKAGLAAAWGELSDQDWEAIAIHEIRSVAWDYWQGNSLYGNPFHPRALVHLDGVADAVMQQPEWELEVRDPRVTKHLTPDGVRALYRAEVERLQSVATDPVMLTHDGPSAIFARTKPGLRELVVQHKASGLRAAFYYGREQAGWVMSKTYSIDSIDSERIETESTRGFSWETYVGLGIGMNLYAHAAEVLPEVRWADKSISPTGKAVRRKLHDLDPWRWHLKECGCSTEWESLTSSDTSTRHTEPT
ncbi:hypothetical protein [Promicromonospora iranensis]|uniref:hypothetical protein n=1 Tax=Promicromonospora iranensis TaxID=1105144 RepID=UPI0023A98101|nr:hypothetical protein [Promicromonospora iranensis]